MQHRFAVKLLGAAREMGIHTALDTNGFYGDKLSDDELECADLVCSTSSPGIPSGIAGLTGMEIGPTLDFARRLAARRRPVWLRYVLVPGLTDNLDDIAQIARFTADLGTVERVDVLPFHRWACTSGSSSRSTTSSRRPSPRRTRWSSRPAPPSGRLD